jgi:hypothetical protein
VLWDLGRHGNANVCLQALLESSKAAQDSAAPAGSAQALELGTLLSRVLAIAQMQDKQASSGPSASEEECSLNLVTSSSVTTVSSTMQQLTMALSSRSYFEALGLYMQVMDAKAEYRLHIMQTGMPRCSLAMPAITSMTPTGHCVLHMCALQHVALGVAG